jgi:hypothetical protein
MADSRDDGLSVVKAPSLPEFSTQTETMMLLADFVPGDWDVICQRGKKILLLLKCSSCIAAFTCLTVHQWFFMLV